MKVMPKKSRNDHVEFTENGLLQIINSNNDNKLVLNLNVKKNGTKKSVYIIFQLQEIEMIRFRKLS